MNAATEQLGEPERQLWLEYERQEDAGLRGPALETLVTFVEAMTSIDPTRRKAWVEAFCREHWDDYDPIQEGWNRRRIRHSLATDLILPVLWDGYSNREAHYARWLGQFALSGVIRGAGLTPPEAVNAGLYDELRNLGMREFDPADLLREALELDPTDTRAAHTLIGYLEETFDYWTHHVPDFVLTDDTATWRSELDEFEQLVERYDPPRHYSFELRFWRLHCDSWEAYLPRKGEFAGYSEYLANVEEHP